MRKYIKNNKTKPVSSRVPEHIFNKINEIANETGASRSEVISSILTVHFNKNTFDTLN